MFDEAGREFAAHDDVRAREAGFDIAFLHMAADKNVARPVGVQARRIVRERGVQA